MMRGMASATSAASGIAAPDRRARRRQETIEEILTIAEDVMSEEGVNGLSLSEVARRLGVKPERAEALHGRAHEESVILEHAE